MIPKNGSWEPSGGFDNGLNFDEWQIMPDSPTVDPEQYREAVREMLDNGVIWGELDEFYQQMLTALFPVEAVALGGTEAVAVGARLGAQFGLSFPELEAGSLLVDNYPKYYFLDENPAAVAGYGVVLYEGADEQWVSVAKGDVTWNGAETQTPVTFQADPGTYMVFYRSVAEIEAGDAEWRTGVVLSSEDGQFSGTLSAGDDLSQEWDSGLLFMIVPYAP
jgi:hypothetical protein